MMTLHTIQKVDAYKSAFESSRYLVLFFYTEWFEPSLQISNVLDSLAMEHSHAVFLKIDAEKLSKLSEAYEVNTIPTYVLIKNKVIVESFTGANISNLVAKIVAFVTDTNIEKKTDVDAIAPACVSTSAKVATTELSLDLSNRIKAIIDSHSIVLFMKGNPEAPRCGFSRQMVQLLQSIPVSFQTFDVLQDDEIRQGLKLYSNWQFFPQLYANGSLVGGLDICKELHANGELVDILKG